MIFLQFHPTFLSIFQTNFEIFFWFGKQKKSLEVKFGEEGGYGNNVNFISFNFDIVTKHMWTMLKQDIFWRNSNIFP